MAVRKSLMAFEEHFRLSERTVFRCCWGFFSGLCHWCDWFPKHSLEHFCYFLSAASPNPPIPKATLMETQTEDAKPDLGESDLVWPFWSTLTLLSISALVRHVVNKVAKHSSCTHFLLLDLKLSETLSDDDTEQLMIYFIFLFLLA